jgi:hypothetical protein
MHGVYISTVSPIPNNKAITLMFARAYSAALQTSVMYNLANDANLMHKMISDTFIPRPTSDSLTTPNSIKNQLLASRAEMKTKEGYDKTVILIQPLSQLALYSSSISADDYIHRFNDMRKSKSKIAPLFYPVDPTLTSEFVRNFLVVQQSLISDTALQSSKSIGEFIQKINSDANVYIKSSILNNKKNTILSSDAKLKQHILSNYHNDYDAIASYKRNRVLEYQLESMSINDSNLSDEIKEVLKSSTEYDKNTGVVLRNGIPYQKYWYWSDEDYSNNIGNRAYLDKSGLWIKISHNVVGQTLVMLSTSLTPNSIEKAKRERKYE